MASIKTDLPVFLQCIGLRTEAGIAIDDFLVNLSIHRKGEVLVHPMMTLAFWFDARRIMSGRMFIDECSEAVSLRDLDLRFDEARRRVGLIDSQGIYKGKRPYSRSLDSILLDRFTRGTYELD